MNFRDRSTVLVVGVISSVFLILGLVVIVQQRHHPSYVDKKRDKDTGELIYNEPNKTSEPQSNPDSLVVLGSPQLISAGLTQDQYQLTKQALASFNKKNLNGKYSVLKILTSDFKSEANNVTAKLRLGESDTLLTLTVHYHDLKFVQVKISDPKGNPAYTFDSGELQTSQLSKPPQNVDTN